MRRRTLLLGALAVTAGFSVYGKEEKASAAGTAAPARRTPARRQPTGRKTPAQIAIRYAAAQAGKPYLYGGTGPDSFDCSGLCMMAYQSAGITIPRDSEDQWAGLPHVTTPRPGDLVFFAGEDGTWDAPGHVGLVTGPNTMIQAYATGTPIGTYPFGTAAALEGTGEDTVVGYARP